MHRDTIRRALASPEPPSYGPRPPRASKLGAILETIEELRRRDYPEEVIHAVQAHAEFLGVPRESLLDKALCACDELSGFIAACAYVRPEGIHGMKTKSVKKKLKQPSFAAGVHRDEVYRGAEELEPESGMSFDEHVQFVIDALEERAGELGLEPDASRS